jgi:hypothetical protein
MNADSVLADTSTTSAEAALVDAAAETCRQHQPTGMQSSLANPKAQDLPLPGIEATGIYSYCANGFSGFIDTEVALRIGCGHSLHPDLQNRYGDAGLENRSQGRIQCRTFDSHKMRIKPVSRATLGFAASSNNLLWQRGFSSTTLCITVCWVVGIP